MSEDTFRPRKAVASTEEDAASLEKGVAVRRAIAQELGEEDMQREGGVQISGNIPPEFKQVLAQKRQGKAAQRSSEPPMRVTGSSTLEGLLDRMKESTHTYHELSLPSLGRFYDGTDGPQDGILHVRPMTGEEEQILATPRLVRRGQAVNIIFNRCMQEQYDSEKFLTPDRTCLLIFLRGLSYTKDYDVEVRCPECNTKFATVIDLDGLWVDKCPVDFNEKDLTGELPTTGFSYQYRISRGSDEQHIQDYRERRLKGFDLAAQADDTLLYRTAMLLDNIEGLSDKTELQLLLKRLPINDVAHLRNVVNNQPFGVDTNIGINCPSCFADFTVDLPLESSFFFPRARKETPNMTRA